LLGGATAGLWLAPARLVAAPRSLVLQVAGRCSFCGRAAEQARGLAGIRGRTARICDQCVELCLRILHEEAPSRRPPPPAPRPGTWAEIEERLAAIAEQFDLDEDTLRREVHQQFERDPGWTQQPMACSFCDAPQQDVAKMIAGPRDFICDGCIAGAATMLESCHAQGH
jgi:hypothetical protein